MQWRGSSLAHAYGLSYLGLPESVLFLWFWQLVVESFVSLPLIDQLVTCCSQPVCLNNISEKSVTSWIIRVCLEVWTIRKASRPVVSMNYTLIHFTDAVGLYYFLLLVGLDDSSKLRTKRLWGFLLRYFGQNWVCCLVYECGLEL